MTTFRTMRRNAQQLPDDEAKEILRRGSFGTLALLGDDGYPYSLPISYVYADGIIYFHSAKSGHKVDAIAKEPKASFSVVASDDVKPAEFTTYYSSVICFGHITAVTDEKEFVAATLALGEKYNPGNREATEAEMARFAGHFLIYKMEIEHMTGKEAKELMMARKKA